MASRAPLVKHAIDAAVSWRNGKGARAPHHPAIRRPPLRHYRVSPTGDKINAGLAVAGTNRVEGMRVSWQTGYPPCHAPRKARFQWANPRKDIVMNSPALGLRVASVVFGLMGLGQLVRIIMFESVKIGSCLIGRRWSAVAFLVLAALCVWLWMLASKTAQPKNETPPAKPAA